MARDDLAQHARQLATAFGVQLLEVLPDRRASVAQRLTLRQGSLYREARFAVVAPIVDEATYAIALHEIGHLAAPTGMLPPDQLTPGLKLEQEHAAWSWARHYALIWTASMEEAEQFGLQTHYTVDHTLRMERVRDVLDRPQALRVWLKKIGG